MCKNDNDKMYRTRTENTNLKAQDQVSTKTIVDLSSQNEELAKSKAYIEERHEAAKVHREHVEQNQVCTASICVLQENEIQRLNTHLTAQEELRQQLVSKDKDMAGKDAKIAKLQRRLCESQKKVDSLEIDFEAENQRAGGPVANVVLNSAELDQTVAALAVAVRHMGHHEGYTECTSHDEARLKVKWENSHCSTSVEVGTVFAKAQESYNHVALPIMDLVSEALQHNDYVAPLKAIFEVPSNEDFDIDHDEDEEEAGGTT
ncbi:hypothetical protein Hanom_Chr09g00778641 [Helianthus anomalus]